MSDPVRPPSSRPPSPSPSPSPLWLRLLAGAVLGLMGAGLLYAVGIGLTRFTAIGV